MASCTMWSLSKTKSPLPVPMSLMTLSPTRQVLSSCEPQFSLPFAAAPAPRGAATAAFTELCALCTWWVGSGGSGLWQKPQTIPTDLVGFKLYMFKVISWARYRIKLCGQLGSLVSLLCHILPGTGRAKEVEKFPLVNVTIIVYVWEH